MPSAPSKPGGGAPPGPSTDPVEAAAATAPTTLMTTPVASSVIQVDRVVVSRTHSDRRTRAKVARYGDGSRGGAVGRGAAAVTVSATVGSFGGGGVLGG